ncbi:MAG: hypothetical protein ACRC1P_06010 [Cellulosilyticaceae bacterium]
MIKRLSNWFKSKREEKKYHIVYEKDNVNRLFEDLEAAYVKKSRIKKYYKSLEEKEEILNQYEKFQPEEIEKLLKWLNEYKNISDKIKFLQGRLIRNNKALYILAQYEDTLPGLISELKSIERKVKESERDIFYLQEEKTELQSEREYLVRGYSFLKGFGIVSVIILGMGTIMSFGVMQTLREAIWIYMSGLGCLFILLLVGLIYAKTKMEKQLKINEFLQHKAVKYSNKAKVRYFHNVRYLQFYFEQLEVDSVAKLEMYHNRYLKNKKNEIAYRENNKELIVVEDQIYKLFEAKQITIENLEGVEDWLLAPKKIKQMKELVEEKQKVIEQMTEIEQYEQTIIEQINDLGEQESYKDIINEKRKDYEQLTKTHLDKVEQCA